MRHTFRYTVRHALAAGQLVELGVDDSHHLTRVIRRRSGDVCEVIDGDGRIWPGVVERTESPVLIRIGDAPRQAAPTVPVALFVGIADWGRLDLVVEKATELGVERFALFASARARRTVDAGAMERRRERWERLADAAARQCGRGTRPEFAGLVPFSAMLADPAIRDAFVLDGSADIGLGAALRAHASDRALVVVGPDTGLTPDEVGQLVDAGATACRLTHHTLRTETAAIGAAAVAADHFGGA